MYMSFAWIHSFGVWLVLWGGGWSVGVFLGRGEDRVAGLLATFFAI